jgi:hypothetical protein
MSAFDLATDRDSKNQLEHAKANPIDLSQFSADNTMSTLIWIFATVAIILVVWFALKTLLAFAVPERVSGIALFKQELKRRGIPYSHLPPQFFEDCVGWAMKLSSLTGHASAVKRKAELVRSIESLAAMVDLWRTEPDSPMFVAHGNQPNTYRTLFERYPLGASVETQDVE